MFGEILETFRARGLFGACAVGAVEGEEILPPEFSGELPPLGDSPPTPLSSDALFDCASLTKSVATAASALVALQEGRTSLDERIADRLPELRTPWRDEIVLRHLLTHTLDYRISLSSLKELSEGEILERILTFRFEKRPGETYLYCNATSLLLGLWLERLERAPLDQIAQERVFGPLGMARTTFYPRSIAPQNLIAPSEVDAWREGEVRGVVHDESAYALRGRGPVGSAGLFSTVSDLQLFLREWLLASEGKGKLFSRETAELVDRNWIPELGDAGLGFERNQKAWMGDCLSGSRIGKTGFTGCSVVLDFGKRRALAVLSNSMWPKRKPRAEVDALRRACAVRFFGD
ncbi:MAG: beta-lactamase family protein [Fibrobacterales bacterium]|nr:beta-lactamase family protein [Fibrobacterales bacterium]